MTDNNNNDTTQVTTDTDTDTNNTDSTVGKTDGVGVGAGAPSQEVAVPAPRLSRNEMRSRIFSAKPKTETVKDFFNCELELRQPSLEIALQNRDASEEDRVYVMLLDYAFVPGTNEKVFEEGDVDAMRKLPFGSEFQDLIDKVNLLLGIDPSKVEASIKEEEKSA